ncbi:hypothetical protein AERO9A_300064 [Aeromonas salmonicida]|nr:hypothetical protein AERO9A_300064 [Aeromonas salmonicida]
MLHQAEYQASKNGIASVKFHTLRNELRQSELLVTLINISH